MRPTGRRSSTRRRPAAPLAALAVLLFLGAGSSARALDLFTLWRQPEIPLDLTPGSWVLYRSQSMISGRRSEDLTRVSCLAAPADADPTDRVFEIVPMSETDEGKFVPVEGQGVRLLVSGRIAERKGDLRDLVREAWQWDDGAAKRLSMDDLRDDPLASRMFAADFHADTVEEGGRSTRIVAGQQFLCTQLVMTERDTQSIDLPAGRMTQVSSHEITVSYDPGLPLLGLAYVAERINSASSLDTSNPRFQAPPPRIRVEVMELIDFGRDAKASLGRGD